MNQYAGFVEGFNLVNELGSELAAVLSLRDQFEPRHWARVVLRSLFALLEAFISRFKGRALQAQEYRKVSFPPKLLRILHEGGSVSRPDGTIDWEHIRPRTTENLKGSLRAYARSLGTETPLGGDVPLPDEFVIALAARNRVTHPKKLEDLNVTPEEFEAAGEILKWFMEISSWSLQHETRNIEEIKQKIDNDIQEQIERHRKETSPGDGAV